MCSSNVDTMLESDLPTGDQIVKVLESRSWPMEFLVRAIVLVLVGFSLWKYQYESLFAVIFLFVLVVPMEKIFPRHKGQPIRRPKWKLDLTYALASPLLNALGVVILCNGLFFHLLGYLVY